MTRAVLVKVLQSGADGLIYNDGKSVTNGGTEREVMLWDDWEKLMLYYDAPKEE